MDKLAIAGGKPIRKKLFTACPRGFSDAPTRHGRNGQR